MVIDRTAVSVDRVARSSDVSHELPRGM